MPEDSIALNEPRGDEVPARDGTGAVYLNHAAGCWPPAPGVIEAVAEALGAMPAVPGRSGGRTSSAPERCRRELAALLGVDDPARIALTAGATAALNIAILGLDLAPGDRVVTSAAEHNSVLRPLRRLQRRRGVDLQIIGLAGGDLDTAAFKEACRRPVALAALTHASNVTGRIFDVGPLFACAKDAGAVTLLDAAQTLGRLPIAPERLHADMVAFPGHKALRGPAGTGGLYLRSGLDLEPVMTGGTGVLSDLPLQPDGMPMRLEAGTPNLPALAGLAAALDWRSREGDAFQARERALAGRLHAGLFRRPGLRLCDPVEDAERLGIAAFRLDGWGVADAGFALEESFGVVCRAGLHCAPLVHAALGCPPDGSVRLSLSGSNTDADIERALAALARMRACGS